MEGRTCRLFLCLWLLCVCQNRGHETDDTCSKDGNCAPPLNSEIPAYTQELMQTITWRHLYETQSEIAKFLELAYISLSDHTELAREVRMTAQSARAQHMMTSDVIKMCMVSAAHIVSTFIPMISDAVELEDVDMIKDSFTLIIDTAIDMKREAEETRDSYFKIQAQVQDNLASVNGRNKQVVDNQTRLMLQTETEVKFARAASRKAEELANEKKAIDDRLMTLKSNSDAILEDAENISKRSGDWTFLDFVGINIIIRLFIGTEYDRKMNEHNESRMKEEHIRGQGNNLLEKIYEHKKESLECFTKLKQILTEEVNLVNTESLLEAGIHLGVVDTQMEKMIAFWDNTTAMLKHLRDDPKSAEVYIQKIENPSYTQKFKASISRMEKGWKSFGRVCNEYVTDTETNIFLLYNFMSSAVDVMSAKQRKARQEKLKNGFEESFNSNVLEDEYQ